MIVGLHRSNFGGFFPGAAVAAPSLSTAISSALSTAAGAPPPSATQTAPAPVTTAPTLFSSLPPRTLSPIVAATPAPGRIATTNAVLSPAAVAALSAPPPPLFVGTPPAPGAAPPRPLWSQVAPTAPTLAPQTQGGIQPIGPQPAPAAAAGVPSWIWWGGGIAAALGLALVFRRR